MQEQHFIIEAQTVDLGIKLRFYNKRDRYHKINAYSQSNYLIVQQAKKSIHFSHLIQPFYIN